MSDITYPDIGFEAPPLYQLCHTFPLPTEREVDRDHHLDTFERVFAGRADLLVLEGDTGMGKTTLLAQFAKRHPRNAIASFVPSLNPSGYDLGLLTTDYSTQLLSILQPRTLHATANERDGVIQSLIQRLKRRRGRNTYYFLYDGLEDVSDPVLQREILRILPIGDGFPVIVSCDASVLSETLRNSQRTKTTQAVNFSFAEVREYLSDLRLEDASVRNIYHASGKGVPASLSSLRRSLLSGADPVRLKGSGLAALFEQEWEHAVTNILSRDIVATAAHSRHKLTLQLLSDLLSNPEADIERCVRQMRFLQIDKESSHVSFVSQHVLELASEKTARQKSDVVKKIVTHLVDHSGGDDVEGIDSLPIYLKESGQARDIIDFLSAEYFSRLLTRSESVFPLLRQMESGMDAAAESRHDGDLVRFCLASSAIREIESAQVSRSEIEVLVATGQLSEALSFAANCPLREDRLHLLGVIARCLDERGIAVSVEVREQVIRLFAQIDARALGEKAIDIAADLFPCFPELAVGLIEQRASVGGDENELDTAYVRLSIAAARRQLGRKSGEQDDLQVIRERIKDPRLRGFTSTLVGRGGTADEVIGECERLDSASDKLMLLRTWTADNARRKDALDVAEFGLRTIIEATGYAPNARVLREISSPLVYTVDTTRALSLVSAFDGQGTAVGARGPTEEVVRLELNLSAAQYSYDESGCISRLLEVYFLVHALEDLSTKSSCLARFLATLRSLDTAGHIEEQEGLVSLCADELEAAISCLLADTAHQADVTRTIIGALASYDFDRAVRLAGSLNTAARREEGILVAIDSVLDGDLECKDLHKLRAACSELRSRESRDYATTAVADHLSRLEPTCNAELLRTAFEVFREPFFAVGDPFERCRVLCLVYTMAESLTNHPSAGFRDGLVTRIDQALGDLQPGSSHIDLGFRVARSFADRDPQKAKIYLSRANAERKSTALSSFSSEWAFQASLRLAMRAFAGQLGEGYDANRDISRIGHLIDQLPSTTVRVRLWAELAMHLLLKHRSDPGNQVVNEQVLPLLAALRDGPARADAIADVAPALYQHHPSTAFTYLDTLEPDQRDTALMTCALFVLEKHIPSDPYEQHDTGYDITYLEALEVADLAHKIKRDNLVYVLIVAIADTLAAPRRANTFSSQQKTHLVGRLRSLARSKFPDQGNIQHDGYAVASDAQILRIAKSANSAWTEVIDRARIIPNRSDRAYVLSIIGHILPPRHANLRDDIFGEAIRITKTIPCNFDRIIRLNDLAGMMLRKSLPLAKQCLSDAMTGFRNPLDGRESFVIREVIDTAFKVDADFAASLVSMMDDDPARSITRIDMNRRLEVLGARQEIIDGPIAWTDENWSSDNLSQSAWLALRSLNAGRSDPASLEGLRPALRAGGKLMLQDGYPIFAWAIESAVRRFGGSADSRATIRDIFEGAMRATELAHLVGTSASVTVRRSTSAAITPTVEGSIVVGRNERARAVEFVKNWLESTACGHVYICDQYFGPSELDLVRLVQSAVPGIEIAVLTSRHCHRQRNIGSLYDAYKDGWGEISDQKPPLAVIVVVGVEGSEKSPIHDRWVLTEQGGIFLGNSWNAIGISQESTLRVLSEKEAAPLSDRLVLFLVEQRREHGGEVLQYETVKL